MMKEERKIYWERQRSDKLCAVHCINTLLQGPYFTEFDLATIAQEIDLKEQQIMQEQGITEDYYKFMKGESNNVALDGNFSIQVISEALKKFQIYLESIDAQVNQNKDLIQEEGFICNSALHWFTIRRIGEVWYNLNSTNRHAPEIISDFYLSAFLQSIKQNGYTIFVAKAEVQFPNDDELVKFFFCKIIEKYFPDLQQNQIWFTPRKVYLIHEKRKKKKNFKLNIGGSDEKDIEKAKKKSLGKEEVEEDSDDEDYENIEEEEDEQQKQKAPQFFQGKGISLSDQSSTQTVNYNKFDMISDEDPELAFAVRMSISEKFTKKPNDGIFIQFIMPEGNQIVWVFTETALIEDLYDFVFFSIPQGQNYKFILSTMYPKTVLKNVYLTLQDSNIDNMTQILVSKL